MILIIHLNDGVKLKKRLKLQVIKRMISKQSSDWRGAVVESRSVREVSLIITLERRRRICRS